MPERVLISDMVLASPVEVPYLELDLGTAGVDSSLLNLLEDLHRLLWINLVVP